MALSDLTPQEWLARLNGRRINDLRRQNHLWGYYDGEQPLNYVARIIHEQDNRFPALVINWPQLVVSALEERLTIEGFRLPDSDSLDDDLEGMWQSNNLAVRQTELHTAAMVTRESYIMLGPGDGRYPLVTVEYPDQVAVERDSRTGRVIAALKVWRDDEVLPREVGRSTAQYDQAVLYLPGRMIEFEHASPVTSARTRWTEGLTTHQTSPLVPVVPVTWRPRRGIGRTELSEILPSADAVNQVATNMLAGIEHHGSPRKYAIGVREKDFVGPNGEQLASWQIANGRVWAIGDDEDGGDVREVKVGQFPAADMRGFHDSIKQLAQIAGSLYGLPQQYMGYFADNPASAEGIRASESRINKRGERAQVVLENPWEEAARIGMAIMGRDPATGDRLETVWRPVATPTRAQEADAAVKLFTAGLIDDELGQEMVGLTRGQIRAMRERSGRARSQAPQIVDRVRAAQVTGAAAAGT